MHDQRWALLLNIFNIGGRPESDLARAANCWRLQPGVTEYSYTSAVVDTKGGSIVTKALSWGTSRHEVKHVFFVCGLTALSVFRVVMMANFFVAEGCWTICFIVLTKFPIVFFVSLQVCLNKHRNRQNTGPFCSPKVLWSAWRFLWTPRIRRQIFLIPCVSSIPLSPGILPLLANIVIRTTPPPLLVCPRNEWKNDHPESCRRVTSGQPSSTSKHGLRQHAADSLEAFAFYFLRR